MVFGEHFDGYNNWIMIGMMLVSIIVMIMDKIIGNVIDMIMVSTIVLKIESIMKVMIDVAMENMMDTMIVRELGIIEVDR